MAIVVTGVFPNSSQAEAALRALRDRSIDASAVGLMLPDQASAARAAGASVAGERAIDWVPEARVIDLATTGCVIVAGRVARCASDLASTRSTWVLTEVLECLGIPGAHAEWYADQVRQGRGLVTVESAGRPEDVAQIMRQNGSLEIPSALRTPEAELTTTLPRTPVSTIIGPERFGPADILPGWRVFEATGMEVGTVERVGGDFLRIRRPGGRPDVEVPWDEIVRIEPNQVELAIPASRVGARAPTAPLGGHRSTVIPSASAVPGPRPEAVRIDEVEPVDVIVTPLPPPENFVPGGPGVSGLPPIEHSDGVEVPTDEAG